MGSPWNSPSQNTGLERDTGILERVAFPSSRELTQPRDWTQVSCIAGIFFTTEPQGKPKNTGVGKQGLHSLNLISGGQLANFNGLL